MRTLAVVAAAGLIVVSCGGSDSSSEVTGPGVTGPGVTGPEVAEPEVAEPEVAEPEVAEPEVTEPVFDVAECPMPVAPDLDVECGTVTVLEDRDDPNGGEVVLAVARVRSRSPDGAASPVVRLTGGPGFAALKTLQATAEEGGVGSNPLLAEHDLVFVDQRGTGFSRPSLDCPERDEAVWQTLSTNDSFEAESEVVLAALAECRGRLEAEGVDLSAYDTVANAADIADVRVAMGIDEWALWGGSYGALLAQEIMRSHPERVIAAVLDSPLAPDETDADRRIRVTDRVFDVLFTGCEESPECNAAYPDLRARFAATLQAYNEMPFAATISDPDGNPREVAITGDELLAGAFTMMYNTDQIPTMPAVIELMEQRSPALQRGFESGFAFLFNHAEAMNVSVDCRDRFHDVTFVEISELVATNPNFGFVYSLESGTACESWAVGALETSFNELVRSDIPTLVLAGTYDPITPPEHGRRVADALASAAFVEFNGTGHGVIRSHVCAQRLVAEFIDNPERPLDAACADEIGPPDFVAE